MMEEKEEGEEEKQRIYGYWERRRREGYGKSGGEGGEVKKEGGAVRVSMAREGGEEHRWKGTCR